MYVVIIVTYVVAAAIVVIVPMANVITYIDKAHWSKDNLARITIQFHFLQG